MQTRITTLIYGLLGISLVGYILPWLMTPTAPLSLGAYDLAEWASLHRSQANTIPVLIVPLLLRIQLLIVSLLVAIFADTSGMRFVAMASIGVLAIAQLPPLEFIISATDNINYQQQFMLASISLIGGLGLTIFNLQRQASLIALVLVGIGFYGAIVGLQQAQSLYAMSLQESMIGSGIVVLCISHLIIGIICLGNLLTKRQLNQSTQSTPAQEIKQGSR